MGFMLVYEIMKKYLGNKLSLGLTFVLLFLAVPLLMGTPKLG